MITLTECNPIKVTVYQRGRRRSIDIYGVEHPSGVIKAGLNEYVFRELQGVQNLMVVYENRQAPMGRVTGIER